MFRAIAFASLLLISPVAAQTCSVMETHKLLPATAESNAGFGDNVAVAGDVMVVGRPQHDVLDPMFISSPGSAEVFERIAGTWQSVAVLRADPIDVQAQFGHCVETDGTVILVGSTVAEVDDGGTLVDSAGAVYVFEKIAGLWTQTQILTSNEPEGGGQFGHSMELDGGALVVGEVEAFYTPNSDSQAGAVHLFLRSGNTFSHSAKIQVPEASFRAQLGQCVAIEGGVIFAGAWKENGGGNEAGAVYVFGFDTVWTVIDKLVPPTPRVRGEFGWSLDVHEGSVVVGGVDYFIGTGQGSAFTFEHAGGGDWVFTQQFNAASTLASDHFGWATRFIDHDTLLVGAILDDDGGPQTGSATLFKRVAGVWTQEGSPFGNADRAAGDLFGFDIDSDGATFIIPAVGNDDGATQNGSVHVFDLVCTLPCPGDIADDFGTIGADGMVSFGDFLALLGLIGPCPGGTPGCVGDIADDFGTLNGGDGMVSFGDFLALLGLIGPCP